MWRKLAAGAIIAAIVCGAAHAEVNEVRMSKQFGLPYLPMIVIEAQQLIEKHAKAAGLGEVKTTWTQRGMARQSTPRQRQKTSLYTIRAASRVSPHELLM